MGVPIDRKPDPTPAPPPKRFLPGQVIKLGPPYMTITRADSPEPLPPMPPEVRRLVEWADSAEERIQSEWGLHSDPRPTEGERIIADVRALYGEKP